MPLFDANSEFNFAFMRFHITGSYCAMVDKYDQFLNTLVWCDDWDVPLKNIHTFIQCYSCAPEIFTVVAHLNVIGF